MSGLVIDFVWIAPIFHISIQSIYKHKIHQTQHSNSQIYSLNIWHLLYSCHAKRSQIVRPLRQLLLLLKELSQRFDSLGNLLERKKGKSFGFFSDMVEIETARQQAPWLLLDFAPCPWISWLASYIKFLGSITLNISSWGLSYQGGNNLQVSQYLALCHISRHSSTSGEGWYHEE